MNPYGQLDPATRIADSNDGPSVMWAEWLAAQRPLLTEEEIDATSFDLDQSGRAIVRGRMLVVVSK